MIQVSPTSVILANPLLMFAHVVRMMLSEELVKYTSVVSTLRKRFQSLDIEELKRLEFHQLMQNKQLVEELGVVLQKLARKVFQRVEQRSSTAC